MKRKNYPKYVPEGDERYGKELYVDNKMGNLVSNLYGVKASHYQKKKNQIETKKNEEKV